MIQCLSTGDFLSGVYGVHEGYLPPAADGPPGVFHPDRPDLQAAGNALGRNYKV